MKIDEEGLEIRLEELDSELFWAKIRKMGSILGQHSSHFPVDGLSNPGLESKFNQQGTNNGCKFLINGMESALSKRQYNETPLTEHRYRRTRQNPSTEGLED